MIENIVPIVVSLKHMVRMDCKFTLLIRNMCSLIKADVSTIIRLQTLDKWVLSVHSGFLPHQ